MPAARHAPAPMPLPSSRPMPRPTNAAACGSGLLGVVIFAMTLPMTRLAVGPAARPQLPPLFVTAGRAALAGLLSVALSALAVRAPRPRRASCGRRCACQRARHGGRLSAVPGAGAAPGGRHACGGGHRRAAAGHRGGRGAGACASGPSAGFWACARGRLRAGAGLRGAGRAAAALIAADGLLLLAVAVRGVGLRGRRQRVARSCRPSR